MRIALGIEYNGANYCGWQSQSGGCGVQDALENAIQAIAGHNVRTHAAGRTDAGVHALMQVVHFDAEVLRAETAWVRGVNAFLPETVRVVWAKAVEDTFHARFSAIQRRYQYLMLNQPTAPAIQADRAGWYHLPLDINAIQKALSYLQGEHDFSAFRASECQAKSPVKDLQIARVKKHSGCFLFEFAANAFLHHQVRNMLGALVYVGNGKYKPEFIKELLLQKDRSLSPPTFSAKGLYLAGVKYNDELDLPNTQREIIML